MMDSWISHEADQKHAEAITRETGASNLTSLFSPCPKRAKGMKEQPLIGQVLSPAETTRKRALAATANFLAIDSGDIVHCAKELARHMAAPTTADWEKVVRLGRYVKKRPRVRLWYKFQETPCQLETHSDTDWAGCKRTRRSTTVGYTVAGSDLIKMWCCRGSQFSGSRIVRLSDSVGRNNGTH